MEKTLKFSIIFLIVALVLNVIGSAVKIKKINKLNNELEESKEKFIKASDECMKFRQEIKNCYFDLKNYIEGAKNSDTLNLDKVLNKIEKINALLGK